MIGYVALAGLLLGFGKAGIAGALGPFVTLVLVLAMPADDALGLALPMLIFADTFTVAAYWRKWDTKLLPVLVGAAVLGIIAGTALISSISEEWLRRFIAVAMLLFAAAYLASRNAVRLQDGHRRWGLAAGAASGFTSTIAHSGGPPIVIYLLAVGLEPKRLVGTTVAFFAVINLIKVPGYFVAGLFDTDLIVSTLWAWITIPIGVILGRWLVDRIDRARFERATVALLAAGAIVLLVT
jgi:uncharacterized membrane protein YfcA